MLTLSNVKGKELPPYMLEKLNATSFHTFRITPETKIEYDDDGNPMPPESSFREDFIKEIEQQCKRKNNKGDIICETKKEQDGLFQKIWNEND